MKVLSLFDGMSCGRIALDQLGIPVEKYYASEIDKYAIQVSVANYPDIEQVGDICNLDPKDYQDVNLMLAGSPCQGFSFAGKQLAFDDPRSALFFEFIRLLKAIKPKYFLLENVRMKKEFLQVISEQVSACYPEIVFGIEPIFINSSLLSAQSRQRYYWTNIPGIKQPEDRGIVLRDILEDNFDSERDKAHCIDANYYKGASVEQYKKKHRRQLVNKPMQVNPSKKASGKQPYIQDRVFHEDGKSHSLTASFADRTNVATRPIKVGMNVEEVKVRKHEVDIVGLQQCILSHYAKCGMSKKEIAKELNDKYSTVEHYFRKLGSDFFSIPSEEHWPQLKEILSITTDKFDKQIMEFEYRDGVFESTQRVYSDEGKSPTLTASNKEQMIETKPKQVGVAVDIKGHDQIKRVYSPEGKSPTVTTCGGGHRQPKVMVSNKRHKIIEKNLGDRITDETLLIGSSQKNAYLGKDKSSSLTEAMGKGGGHVPMVRGDSVVVEKSHPLKANYYKSSRANFENDRSKGGKFSATGVQQEDFTWRKLTPLECERLQTVPDNYTNHVSNTQRFKMLGNGWTVEVIKHIFQNMEIE